MAGLLSVYTEVIVIFLPGKFRQAKAADADAVDAPVCFAGGDLRTAEMAEHAGERGLLITQNFSSKKY